MLLSDLFGKEPVAYAGGNPCFDERSGVVDQACLAAASVGQANNTTDQPWWWDMGLPPVPAGPGYIPDSGPVVFTATATAKPDNSWLWLLLLLLVLWQASRK